LEFKKEIDGCKRTITPSHGIKAQQCDFKVLAFLIQAHSNVFLKQTALLENKTLSKLTFSFLPLFFFSNVGTFWKSSYSQTSSFSL